MDQLISLETAARELGTNVAGVRELRHDGQLTPYRFRGSRLEVVAASEVRALARRSGMPKRTRVGR